MIFTVRDGDTVKHYRIRQLDEGGFFIARRTTFRTLQELVEHYSSDADGLCVNLRKPCVQVSFIFNFDFRTIHITFSWIILCFFFLISSSQFLHYSIYFFLLPSFINLNMIFNFVS